MIKLNKPIEDMKNEVAMGMDWRELLFVAIAIVVAGAIFIFLAVVIELSPVIAVYISVPCAAPIIFIGMYKKQGKTLFQFQKMKRWQKKVGTLVHEAREMTDEIFVWSMKRK